jgi:spore coat polysaccharide biosynthesis protein SpsF
MKIPIVLQARTGSSRFPSKVLKKILGKPMLHYIIERLKIPEESFVILAVPNTDKDRVLCKLADEEEIPCIRGSEEDVLSRYYKVGLEFPSDYYIRATADNPLVDYESVLRLIKYIKENKDIDYACEKELPYGAAVEIFSEKALEISNNLAKEKRDREHVTLFIKNHPELFKIDFPIAPKKLRYPELRITVDYEKDFLFIKKIYEKYYKGSPISLSDNIKNIIKEAMNEKK